MDIDTTATFYASPDRNDGIRRTEATGDTPRALTWLRSRDSRAIARPQLPGMPPVPVVRDPGTYPTARRFRVARQVSLLV